MINKLSSTVTAGDFGPFRKKYNKGVCVLHTAGKSLNHYWTSTATSKLLFRFYFKHRFDNYNPKIQCDLDLRAMFYWAMLLREHHLLLMFDKDPKI
jgi:hypothetical protein